VAKLYAYWIMRNYRESYGMFASNGILFNHESPRRGIDFVTRKISLAACRISQGLQDKLYLGNLDASRDWGHAKDYTEGMWKILQHKKADDFVIATGEMHTVREFAEIAFKHCGIDLEWDGKGVEEIGINQENGEVLVEVDPKFFRPAEVNLLIGDSSKARNELGWKPKISFNQLVEDMICSDMEYIKNK
jgi:GDPmannose 4,6-dehydratase